MQSTYTHARKHTRNTHTYTQGTIFLSLFLSFSLSLSLSLSLSQPEIGHKSPRLAATQVRPRRCLLPLHNTTSNKKTFPIHPRLVRKGKKRHLSPEKKVITVLEEVVAAALVVVVVVVVMMMVVIMVVVVVVVVKSNYSKSHNYLFVFSQISLSFYVSTTHLTGREGKGREGEGSGAPVTLPSSLPPSLHHRRTEQEREKGKSTPTPYSPNTIPFSVTLPPYAQGKLQLITDNYPLMSSRMCRKPPKKTQQKGHDLVAAGTRHNTPPSRQGGGLWGVGWETITGYLIASITSCRCSVDLRGGWVGGGEGLVG